MTNIHNKKCWGILQVPPSRLNFCFLATLVDLHFTPVSWSWGRGDKAPNRVKTATDELILEGLILSTTHPPTSFCWTKTSGW